MLEKVSKWLLEVVGLPRPAVVAVMVLLYFLLLYIDKFIEDPLWVTMMTFVVLVCGSFFYGAWGVAIALYNGGGFGVARNGDEIARGSDIASVGIHAAVGFFILAAIILVIAGVVARVNDIVPERKNQDD